MAILDKLHFDRETTNDTNTVSMVEQPTIRTMADAIAPSNDDIETGFPGDLKQNDAVPDPDAQLGVRKMEAAALAWSKKSLAALLCLLVPFVTSSFQSHSLLTVINVVADAMTAAIYIPMAKMLDVWGRAEGFLLMVCFSTLGLILMAASHDLATFCAAQVFYSVGFSGLIYTIVVLAADATNLRNRGLAFAFTSSPYMITAFAGSKAAEGFLLNVSWRWGFGAFAIILPFVTVPLYLVLKSAESKAKKQGILYSESSGRSIGQRIWHVIVQFDLPGVMLFAGGFTVFLLPFTLARSAPNGWKTDYIIAMIVVGFVVLVLFAIYQVYIAPAPFLKNKFLTNRTVVGACLIDATYQMSYYCWNSYFTSFLQVVNNLSVSEAGYVNSTFQVVSGVLLFIVGYLIRRTGRFKWLFYIAVPLYIFAQGLMIYFRRPNQNIGYIVMCEIFISIAGSIFILCVQLAVLAAVDHQYVAAVLAVLFVSGTIGGAVGNAISGAIWTNTFESALERFLPADALPELATIYASLPVQLSYPVGSPVRLAIQEAYGYAQTRMLAAGTGIMVLCFVWILLLQNFNVSKMSQTKGVVF
ncbi:MFS siderochrome iron transporter MirB [Truncatella angustata]|uniref:MFS siderochrome iron transporter MirB n=1 Tax=Truncatella angustata TaxID=152316 RepID=A0A9P8UTZ4_9PEZI|nr:MFS siderochrome iron transporter MirB [Truncatella angustata]KAH6658286.1 MFS siderochrome iron transporter MirB [Truncatella angustata]